jgi:membrane fusion protein, multidrug efflux system
MKRSVIIACSITFGFICLLAFVKYWKISSAIAEHANFKPPPETVTSLIVQEKELPETLSAIGSLIPDKGVTLRAEESGKIVKLNFESGSNVEAGTVLLEMDTSVEEANLNMALARKQRADRDLQRMQALSNQNAMSKGDLDSALFEAKSASASVDSLKALIQRKKIVAPFSGQTGIRAVNIGQYLNPGDAVVSLQQLNSLFVNFSVPQKYLSKLSVGQEIVVSVDAYEKELFTGKINAINPEIDSTTRNIILQGTIPNFEHRLRAGMSVRIRLNLSSKIKAIFIPLSSIAYAPYGDMIYIIEPTKNPTVTEPRAIRQQVVKLGPRIGDLVAVLEGLKVSEEVITSGTFKLQPSSMVIVNNNVSPGNSIAPSPSDT